jgi:hypothetical protein
MNNLREFAIKNHLDVPRGRQRAADFFNPANASPADYWRCFV